MHAKGKLVRPVLRKDYEILAVFLVRSFPAFILLWFQKALEKVDANTRTAFCRWCGVVVPLGMLK